MRKEELRAALQWAYMMGQKYWAQADSEYPSDWKKADVTRVTFEQFVENTLAALEKSRPWVPLTDEDLSVCDEDGVILARYWEAKLREKNT